MKCRLSGQLSTCYSAPVEELRDIEQTKDLVERVLLAYYPNPDEEARDVARKMMAVCLTEKTPVDWDEVERLAGIRHYR